MRKYSKKCQFRGKKGECGMKIEVMSRKEVGTLLRANGHAVPKNNRIVSIRNTDQYRLHKDCPEILNLRFDDVLGNDDRKMTLEQAALVAEFARKAYEDDCDIIVHCHGGVSRSAGCAAAIAEGLAKELGADTAGVSDYIWHSAKYIPNEYVYDMVCRQFGIEYSPEEIRRKIKEHADAWLAHPEDRVH